MTRLSDNRKIELLAREILSISRGFYHIKRLNSFNMELSKILKRKRNPLRLYSKITTIQYKIRRILSEDVEKIKKELLLERIELENDLNKLNKFVKRGK